MTLSSEQAVAIIEKYAPSAAYSSFERVVDAMAQAMREAAAEATAAYRARLRAQAIAADPREHSSPSCSLCGYKWLWSEPEHHARGCMAAPDGQPCAAEVEP
jgi:hypothetical protein